jgi:uncharacterized protein (DUF2147 family)
MKTSIRRKFSRLSSRTRRRTLPISVAAALFALLSARAAFAQTDHLLGLWREPGGTIIEVHPCGNELCARLVSISSQIPALYDSLNPNAAQRLRPLCGLQVGWGFHLADPDHAISGSIYDPRSGTSYHATLTAEGNELHLTSIAWLKIFNHTETWTRVDRSIPACKL